MSSGAQGRDAVTRQRGAWSFEPFATVEELDEIEAMQAELVALRAEVARLRGVARPVCYACDAVPVGTRDRRPEGGGIEAACARHADPVVALPAMPIDVEHERRVDEAIAKRAQAVAEARRAGEMSGAKRIGPRVTVHRSCDGCAHERATYYACQGDTGYHHDCAHPAHKEPRRIGYSSGTPGWCPEIASALDGWGAPMSGRIVFVKWLCVACQVGR